MPTTITVSEPAGIQAVHARVSTGHYHRFEPTKTMTSLQDPVNDNSAFSSTSITFTAVGNSVVPWFPAGIVNLHVVLTNGHYYRFEANGQAVAMQAGDSTSTFTTVSFSTS